MIHGRARARLGIAVLALALAALARPTPALSRSDADSAAIPAAVGYVNDFAGVMDEPSRARLEAFLDQVEKKTGAQLAVLTVRTTAPLDPMDYKVRVFERWKLGKQGEDNGLLMLVAVAETQVRFETGYGLEGTLPDGVQSRIYRQVMRPYLRAGDMSGGITQGMLASAARIAAEKGVTLEWDGRELRYTGGGGRPNRNAMFIALAIFLIVMSVMSRMQRYGRRGRWTGPGGLGGWGGGFGGYGGMGGFGGGGGGGGSFGGFGGGSSGGGGGGGGGSGGW